MCSIISTAYFLGITTYCVILTREFNSPAIGFEVLSNIFGQLFYCWACYIYTGKIFRFQIVGGMIDEQPKSVYKKFVTLVHCLLYSTHTGRADDVDIQDTDWAPSVLEVVGVV